MKSNRPGTTVVWALALLTALFAARYLLVPPVWLKPPLPGWLDRIGDPVFEAGRNIAPYLYERHRVVLLAHISAGIVALLIGPFQFVRSLREARPSLHRTLGAIYLSAVAVAGVTGFPLSFLVLDAVPEPLRTRVYPMVAGFASLAVAWLWICGVAFRRARQCRFAEHRHWMLRGYSLTFAAVTVRIVAPILLLLTGSITIATNGGILSWPLNLIVAEWLIRRETSEPLVREPSPQRS